MHCQDEAIVVIRKNATSVLDGDRKYGRRHYALHSETCLQSGWLVGRDVVSGRRVWVAKFLGLKAA